MKLKLLFLIFSSYFVVNWINAQRVKLIGETLSGERFEIDSTGKGFDLYYVDQNNIREFITTTFYNEIYSIFFSKNNSVLGRKEVAIIFNGKPAPVYFTAIRQLDKPHRKSAFSLTYGKWVVLMSDGIIGEITSTTYWKQIEDVRWKSREMFELIYKSYLRGGIKKITDPTTYFLSDGNLWIYPTCDTTKIIKGNSLNNLINSKEKGNVK